MKNAITMPKATDGTHRAQVVDRLGVASVHGRLGKVALHGSLSECRHPVHMPGQDHGRTHPREKASGYPEIGDGGNNGLAKRRLVGPILSPFVR